jgi:hypothetical protein
MNSPKFTEELIYKPSADLVDEIYNTSVFNNCWYLSKDLNERKYAVTGFSLGDDIFGSYVISCEDFDPCRIAWERGEINRDEFWERFGYVWRLEPIGGGELSVERYPNHRIEHIITFMGLFVCNSPIEWMENRFQEILMNPKLDQFQSLKWQRHHQRFRAAVAAREKQLVDAGFAKQAA